MQIIKSNRLWFFFYFISYLLSFFFCIIFKGIYKQKEEQTKTFTFFFFNFFNNINLVLIRDVILFYKTENNKNKFVSNIVLLFI